MMPIPKTIQIFLPGGDPQGVRVAEITTRIVQVIEVPRVLLTEFLAMPESDQVALYALIGESDDDEPIVYIGQTGDLKTRLARHNREKEFWERVLVVVSRTNSLTQTHAVFLEWYCLNACRTAGRYRDENGNSGSKPHTPAPLEADCLEIFDTAKTLIATLGYPLFDPVARVSATVRESENVSNDDEQQIYYCKKHGVDGRGLFTSEGFVVLKGSRGRAENEPSLIGHHYERMRAELIDSGECTIEGNDIVFQKDRLFNKPSPAAVALLAQPSNGWMEWKDEAGRTLDELKRQQ